MTDPAMTIVDRGKIKTDRGDFYRTEVRNGPDSAPHWIDVAACIVEGLRGSFRRQHIIDEAIESLQRRDLL